MYGTHISLRIELEKVSQISKLGGLSLVTQGAVTNLLNELGWVPLKRHRLNTRLVVMWKVINNQHISLPMPTNVIHKQQVTRQFHPNKFIQLSVSRNVYKFSFVSKTLKEWNNLSNDVIEITTLNTFRCAVSEIAFDLR